MNNVTTHTDTAAGSAVTVNAELMDLPSPFPCLQSRDFICEIRFFTCSMGARSLWINMAALIGPFSIPFGRGLDHLDSPTSISANPANLHQRTPTSSSSSSLHPTLSGSWIGGVSEEAQSNWHLLLLLLLLLLLVFDLGAETALL